MPVDPRRTGPYITARRRFIARHPNGSPCFMCGRPVDTRLSGNAPDGPSVEHTLPVRDHPHLALEVDLWRLCHRRCNDRQGAEVTNAARRGERPQAGTPSRDW